MRRDGGPAYTVRATPDAASVGTASQWFSTQLPVLDPGRRIDYRIDLMRMGQRLASLPRDRSWLTVIGDPQPAPAETASRVEGVPRWGYEMDFFAALTITFREEVIGETPEGFRANFFVVDGTVIGPKISARIRPEGGDWLCVRRDGVAVVNVRITYELSDGGLILEECGGRLDLGPDGYTLAASGAFSGRAPFYATPTWSTAQPGWTWLNRCQGVEVGWVDGRRNQVQGDIYLPRVGGGRDDG